MTVFGLHLNPVVWILISAVNVTLFWSLVHEVVHGHPTSHPLINRFLVIFPIGWVFPYERFRDTHMDHHRTERLTDPFDDPESWYVYRSKWEQMNSLKRYILLFNNTLFGRMLIGPALTVCKFIFEELQRVFSNHPQRNYLISVWGLHFLLCLFLATFISMMSTVPGWYYIIATYLGISLLLVRTFLEHQAAENQSERTVIIEKCCPLAFLFLFNNLHVVHHMQPGIAWYLLPRTYRASRGTYIRSSESYIYASYGEIFRKYFFKPKEDVVHPFANYEVTTKSEA